jgi:hypothetical protein
LRIVCAVTWNSDATSETVSSREPGMSVPKVEVVRGRTRQLSSSLRRLLGPPALGDVPTQLVDPALQLPYRVIQPVSLRAHLLAVAKLSLQSCALCSGASERIVAGVQGRTQARALRRMIVAGASTARRHGRVQLSKRNLDSLALALELSDTGLDVAEALDRSHRQRAALCSQALELLAHRRQLVPAVRRERELGARGRPLLRHFAIRPSRGRELRIVGASCGDQLLDRELLGVALAHVLCRTREQLGALHRRTTLPGARSDRSWTCRSSVMSRRVVPRARERAV